MKLDLHHVTTYKYSAVVSHGLQQLRLVAETNAKQTVNSWDVDLTGATTQVSFRDHHGNPTQLVSIEAGDELRIAVSGSVVTNDLSGVSGEDLRSRMPIMAYRRPTSLTNSGEHVLKLASELPINAGGTTIDQLHKLSAMIRDRIDYVIGATDTTTTAEQTLTGGAGVCQDHTHVFLAAARALGVPARYVSGYLWLNDRVDQAASHAWAEAWLPDLGWVGFDVSNQISPDDRYVQLAVGLDYRDAAPVSGVRFGGGVETLAVSLSLASNDASQQGQQ